MYHTLAGTAVLGDTNVRKMHVQFGIQQTTNIPMTSPRVFAAL